MRISILLISILALFIGFTSCEDDDDDEVKSTVSHYASSVDDDA